MNADDPAYIGDSGIEGNLYAYCGNNAVNMEDPDGHFALGLKIARFIADSLISVVVIFLVHKLKAIKNKTSINRRSFIKDCAVAILKCFASSVVGTGWAKRFANTIISFWNARNNKTSFFKKVVIFIMTYATLEIADRLDNKMPSTSVLYRGQGWIRVSMCGGKYAIKLSFATVITSIQETFAIILRRI